MSSDDIDPMFFYPLDRLRNWVAQQGDRWFTDDEAQAANTYILVRPALLRMRGKGEVDQDGKKLFRKRALPEVVTRVLKDSDGTTIIERTMVRQKLDEEGRMLFGKWKNRTVDEVAQQTDCSYLLWMLDERIGSKTEQKAVKDAIKRWEKRTGRRAGEEAEMAAEDATWD